MKRLLLLTTVISLAFNVVESKNLKARFAYATFYSPEKGPYVETYLSVLGNSVNYVPVNDGKTQASIEVSIVFKQAETIKYFDKYNLLSPIIDAEKSPVFNFLDQQRIPLPNGNYQMELTIHDKSGDSKPYTMTQQIKLEYYPNIVSVSDIELLDSYTKSTDASDVLIRNGYKLVPLVDNFFDENANHIKFYAEIYNTSEIISNDSYLLTYHIETFEGKQIIESFKRFNKQPAKPVNVLLTEYDISNLASGNYNLVVEVRNRNNELLATRETFFQRSKIESQAESGQLDFKTLDVSQTFVAQITNNDSLAEYIKCLRPISGTAESSFADNQLAISDTKMMQQFFYDFWQRKNPENPYLGWMTYKAEVDKVNENYSQSRRKGYDTDQGRVYLQYGPPNSISRNYTEPNTYPYEIWHYYVIKNQRNKKFIFYNPDLVSKSFTLLHSDAIGEINDAQWQMRLYRRTLQNTDFDQERTKQGFGQHSNEQYTNPH